jgi:serine phosphatase RsbU (regulator of sigma subunit)
MSEDYAALGELPLWTSLDAVADVAFDRIAGLARTVLNVPVALVSLVDRERQVFPGQSGLPAPWCDSRSTPLTHSFCQHVVRTRAPLVVADARLDPALKSNLAITDIGVVAYAGIPLVDVNDVVVGSLCAIDTEPHEWRTAEISLLSDLAATCSAELQLRSVAASAGRAQRRTSALLSLSEALSSTVTIEDISDAVSKAALGWLGASFGGVTVLDSSTEMLTYVEMPALPGVAPGADRAFPLSRRAPSSVAARTGESFYFASLEEMQSAFPAAAQTLIDSEVKRSAYLPLRVADEIVGTLAILWSEPRSFSIQERAVLSGLARYTAQAIERASLLADRREVAEVLQAAMLPTLPSVGWAELVCRYAPARVADAVGGDWYEAFLLSDGSLAVSVGDVAGHDIEAAAVMGQMRSTLRGLTIAVGGQPSDVLRAMDNVLVQLPPERYATGILATISRREKSRHPISAGARTQNDTTWSWSNAGHPSPLLLLPDQTATFLTRTPAPPIGLRRGGAPRTTHTMTLPAGSTVLLYTDGLIERRHRDYDDTLQDLAASAQRHQHRDLDAMVDAILENLVGGAHEDDIVLLGLRTAMPA